MNPLTDALWAIDDHHHATKASITADQKFQSIERNMSVSKNIDIIPVRRVPHVASFLQQAQLSKGALWLIYSYK